MSIDDIQIQEDATGFWAIGEHAGDKFSAAVAVYLRKLYDGGLVPNFYELARLERFTAMIRPSNPENSLSSSAYVRCPPQFGAWIVTRCDVIWGKTSRRTGSNG